MDTSIQQIIWCTKASKGTLKSHWHKSMNKIIADTEFSLGTVHEKLQMDFFSSKVFFIDNFK